ncbi:MFS transporter, MHS family, proline/betaine transporter [Sphingomonas gellani]|uniref:MFS transporter, MHS family, proline/betaine transporter n=1 Tax=Sphingomonas gellani TaxID=1166340 RepID=A0A1H8IWK6_9SPHN|nr:MFS transporter [Sphingomonas gellani]SEN72078.1 MFS transporter, MHS family, proline/betaine transporter [Sphingomonas gellani]
MPKAPPAITTRSMALAAFSTVVEWYDFTVYLYLATVLARVFYGGGGTSLAATLGGFAIAYLMRPLGAVVFGHVGDRYGRRRTLLLSMALMTGAMLATAMLPTHAAIGPAAGWLLLALRCVMAFAVGGEYTGVVAYLLEGARPNQRGLVTATAAAASEVGGLAAVGISALTVGAMSTAALDGWGWRIPFLVGAALAAVVWIARSAMDESPDWERARAEGTVPDNPLRTALTHHRAGIARGFAISALGSITYYVGITYVPAFLTTVGRLAETRALWLSTVAAVVVIAVTPLVGALSDRWGRRPVLVALALLAAVLPLTLFGWMAGGSAAEVTAGALLLAALAGGVSAVGAVATAEQFPGEGRLSGLAFGATTATAIFGGLTPLGAHLLTERTGWAPAPGAMIAVVALVVLPVLIRLPRPKTDG